MVISSYLFASEVAETSAGFGLNSDILETNLINILIILALLFYVGRGFIGKILSQRLLTIETAINDAERRKQEAIESLSDQQGKLAQAQAERDRLIAQSEKDANTARESILAGVAADIERLKAAATQEIATEQEKVLIQLRQQVAEKALAEVEIYFSRGLDDSVQKKLVDRSIELIGAKS